MRFVHVTDTKEVVISSSLNLLSLMCFLPTISITSHQTPNAISTKSSFFINLQKSESYPLHMHSHMIILISEKSHLTFAVFHSAEISRINPRQDSSHEANPAHNSNHNLASFLYTHPYNVNSHHRPSKFFSFTS